MCTNPDRPWPSWDGSLLYDFSSIINRLEKSKEKIKAAESIYLTGGEPTLHPHFLEIFKYLKENFPSQRIKLLSNGRRFFYKDFTQEFLEITDNLEVDISLHGPNDIIHDGVTGSKDSFKQTLAGLKNLLYNKKQKQIIGVRTVITRQNYKYLDQTLKLLATEAPSLNRVIIIFHELEAQAIKNLSEVGITYQELRPFIEKVRSFLNDFQELRFYHFPLCSLPLDFWPYVWNTLPKKEVSFLPECRLCFYRKFCLGIHKGYLKNIGRQGFIPLDKGEIRLDFNPDLYHPIKKVYYK